MYLCFIRSAIGRNNKGSGERKSTDSASWKSKHDRGNFVPIGGNMSVSLFSGDDDNLYEGEILPRSAYVSACASPQNTTVRIMLCPDLKSMRFIRRPWLPLRRVEGSIRSDTL